MIIKSLTVGPIMSNCFVVGCPDTRAAVVIDPGDDGVHDALALVYLLKQPQCKLLGITTVGGQ